MNDSEPEEEFSGTAEQKQSDAQNWGAGGDVCEDDLAPHLFTASAIAVQLPGSLRVAQGSEIRKNREDGPGVMALV